LSDPERYSSVFYTLRRGALQVTVESMYCRGRLYFLKNAHCLTRYHPDYYVRNASGADAHRVYYHGVPAAIGITEHAFIEPELCVLIENMYLFSHASSEAIARIYNRSLTQELSETKLRGALVLEAFFLHALLRFYSQRQGSLTVPHHGKKEHRLDAALHFRNSAMAGTGQPQWAHACNSCMKLKRDPNGRLYRQSACVVDGVSITHSCCGFKSAAGLPCKTPLARPMDRFCPEHASRLEFCAVKGCSNACEIGFKSCSAPDHRQQELKLTAKGKSMFELKERAAAAADFVATGKTTFQRSWTHNEQLAVRCCGVIISRATFFQAEAIQGVKDFIMSTFPTDRYPGCKPSFIFYDDNCHLWKYLNALPQDSPIREFFKRIGLPVDVFHFSSKHKEGDLVCQTHCNPANFPDLVNQADGSWTYNSSAAEQANRWLNKFKGIVREMNALSFNFFLDEMIMLRNEFTVQGLKDKGTMPHIIP
ncbi:hypothetical protein EXIGLDRAFT_592899, partial [Exidia glandulosa HHB12029]